MKVPGIDIADIQESGEIDGGELLLVLENSNLRLKSIDQAKGFYKIFSPTRMLSALVASSTASCTSGVVTVAATAHGISSNAAFTGCEFYYPGSPSLAAGWYPNYARIGVDSISFSAPGVANFASESVNSGNAFVDEVTVASVTIPANVLLPSTYVEIPFFRASGSAAGTKTHKLKIGSSAIVTIANTSTSLVIGLSSLGFVVSAPGKAVGHVSQIGTLAGTATPVTFDPSVAQTISITHQVSAATLFIYSSVMALRAT